jgi:hypothetical protein
MTRDGTTQYIFSTGTPGQLMFEKDLNGNEVTLGYPSGNLSTVKGQSGVRQLSFSWTGSNITTVTDSAGRTASFTYSSGNLATELNRAGMLGDPLPWKRGWSHGIKRRTEAPFGAPVNR